ncbi:MAG: nitroreductase [Chitinophagaceae bacterium]|nr:nitroreductase [Chitinophagaceae bacterium]
MNNSPTRQVEDIIRLRRTIKPEKMNGNAIPDEQIMELLSLADWAPTHARTEPWRFIVFGDEQVDEFCITHARLYKEHTAEASFTKEKQDKLLHIGDNASHVILCYMKRVSNHKIPEIEEIAATACAIQNLLLAAAARGIAAFWSTGGLTHHPAMKAHFGLGADDYMLGILYLGYSDQPPLMEGSRMIPLEEKIRWVR